MTKMKAVFIIITLLFGIPIFTIFVGMINVASNISVLIGFVGAIAVICSMSYSLYFGIKWFVSKSINFARGEIKSFNSEQEKK